MVKVEVKHLTKIFGKKTQAALDMMNDHQPKTEILKKTGATVGVYDVNFDVKEGEIFVIREREIHIDPSIESSDRANFRQYLY